MVSSALPFWLLWQEPPTTVWPKNARGLHPFSLTVLVHFKIFFHHFLWPHSDRRREDAVRSTTPSGVQILGGNNDLSSYHAYPFSCTPEFESPSLGVNNMRFQLFISPSNSTNVTQRIAHGARAFYAPVQHIVLLILYIIKQILGWGLYQKDLHFVLHAKGHNYPAYGANFQGYDLNTWINGEPLPGL